MLSIKKLYFQDEICDTTQIKSVSINNYENISSDIDI